MTPKHKYYHQSSRDSGETSEPGLQEYDSRELDGIKEYKYRRLQPGKKRIRLIKLKTGNTDNREIVCEFYVAEYDTTFHIPRKISRDQETDGNRKKTGNEGTRSPPLSESYQDREDVDQAGVSNQEKSETHEREKRHKLKESRKALQQRSKKQRADDEEKNADEEMERFKEAQKNRVDYEALSWCWGSDEPRYALKIEEGNDTYKFKALQMLMQTEWFSRRWVVQEIALAKKATVYCGNDSMPWKGFAIAVELFVEVETATHRLSEIMQNDEKFQHVAGWFEHVSELGASLLVQATGKVFRGPASPLHELEGDDTDSESDSEQDLERWSRIQAELAQPGVSTMFIFKAAEPRDVIYSLLAIARDAAPFAGVTSDEDDPTFLTMTLFDQFLEEKPFLIDYSRPYSDVCRDFVRFVIKRKSKIDAVQALDILCRPWSLEQPDGRSIRLRPHHDDYFDDTYNRGIMAPPGEDPPRNSYPLPEGGSEEWIKLKDWCDDHKQKTSDAVNKRRAEKAKRLKERDEMSKRESEDRGPRNRKSKGRRTKNRRSKHKSPNQVDESQTDRDVKDVELPSWVARASRAPFSLDNHPGMRVMRMGRANADPLVGPPTDGHRNYSAAQTRHVNLGVLKFRKRPELGHYSMYVQGFELDEVTEVVDASQGGSIPLGVSLRRGPPDELWRTLVADRGRDNRNPPYYYARACRESVHKGNINSGRVKTGALINNERNSIVTEFCRRVHAVIWNRRMFKTKAGRLGLAYDVEVGDKICVLYGCTVPVVLKQKKKKRPDPEENEEGDLASEKLEDAKEALKACIRQCEKNRERKKKRKGRDEKNKKKWLESGEWYEMMDAKKTAENRLEREREGKMMDLQAKQIKNAMSARFQALVSTLVLAMIATMAWVVGQRVRDDGAGVYKTSFQEKVEEAEKDDPHLFYTFRGDCYLHGMMDGEAVRHKFYEEIPDRIFELR
ncbi:uncharacterized protein PG986_002512 [Apiospora aurea]|uniref:Heterokaryon incompatibility domain-containing protein n=1 Tax=Apiospora aurea TaxID=335848 RepID=A0ABR1QP19_9PEZI